GRPGQAVPLGPPPATALPRLVAAEGRGTPMLRGRPAPDAAAAGGPGQARRVSQPFAAEPPGGRAVRRRPPPRGRRGAGLGPDGRGPGGGGAAGAAGEDTPGTYPGAGGGSPTEPPSP